MRLDGREYIEWAFTRLPWRIPAEDEAQQVIFAGARSAERRWKLFRILETLNSMPD